VADWCNQESKGVTSRVDRYRNGRFRSDRKRALACIFLNRTSFSGIISKSAGPIGGRNQKSPYPINCRFTKSTDHPSNPKCGEAKDRVLFVHQGPWLETIQLVKAQGYQNDDLFLYLDPPFYHEASRLITASSAKKTIRHSRRITFNWEFLTS